MNPVIRISVAGTFCLLFLAGCYSTREIRTADIAQSGAESFDTASSQLQAVTLADGGKAVFKDAPLITDSLVTPTREYDVTYSPFRCALSEAQTFIHAANKNFIARMESTDGSIIHFPEQDGWVSDSVLVASRAVVQRKTPISRKDIRGYFYKEFDKEATVKLAAFVPSVVLFTAATIGIVVLAGYVIVWANGGVLR